MFILQRCLSFNQNVGIIGGKPNQAHWFIGCVGKYKIKDNIFIGCVG